jgi:hydroxymethylglutaryl-CoA lyase
MTAFGCNYEGFVPTERVCLMVSQLLDLAAEAGRKLHGVYLADTVGWGTPLSIERTIGAVRERWPDLPLALHLHDTRGTGLANAAAALKLGVAQFDSTCAGLGGCPFAAHKGAAGNICTEDFVFMCEEMGISTGVDLEKLIDCAQMAEEIVGHPLPGKVLRAGSLKRFRDAALAA